VKDKSAWAGAGGMVMLFSSN